MKRWIATASLVLTSSTLLAQDSKELILTQAPFAAYSALWPNLHSVLWAEAWARRPLSADMDTGMLREPLRGDLTPDERRVWDAAVAYYDEEIADLHPLFEMRAIRKAMLIADADLPVDGLDPAHRDVLIAAAPVYRKHWWPAHDAANRAWLREVMSRVATLTPAVPERLARLYGTPWFSGGIRVDVVPVASREGAFSSIDPPPAHITISSSLPAIQGWGAAEILFHEASHPLAFPLMDEFAAELRTQRKAAPHLWHVALFYLTGEVVRQELGRLGIEYQPYLYRTGLFERAWPQLKAPVERHWKPYVDGALPRRDAVAHVVSAADGIDMWRGAYFADVLFRTRLAELASMLVVAIWAGLAFRSGRHPGTVLVFVLVTAFLAFNVRTLTIAAANVAVAALATGSSLFAARALVSTVAGRSTVRRTAVAVLAAPVGYMVGREAAILAVWALAALAA